MLAMSTGNIASARIDALLRYPVKSMLGEQVETTVIGERGLLGDRAYALVEQETGKVASAKNPRRWGMLFQCRAEYVESPLESSELPPVRITLPDGGSTDSDDARVHELLSRVVGRPVRLETQAREGAVIEVYRPDVEGIPEAERETVTDEPFAIVAPGTFFDAAPLHVVTSATLARLGELAPESSFPARRFRPNVVVAVGDEPGFVENEWVDHSVALGAEVRASVFIAAPRCVMTTLAQDDLPRDPSVLQTIARHNRFDIPGLGPSSCVGVYALVTTGGTARQGDPVQIR
jgi:uncharacterized protein YcbX